MPRQQLKPKDKVVLKMTRDGAVEENLTKGTQENISRRQKDAELVKPTEIQPEETGTVQKRRKQPRPIQEDGQPSPDTQQPRQENEQPAQQDTAAQENPAVMEGQPETVFHEEPARAVLRQEAPHVPQGGRNHAAVDAVITGNMGKSRKQPAPDADAILSKAAETAADRPVAGDAEIPPTRKIQRLQDKSDKAHERLDAAREKLPTHKVIRKERVFDEETGKGKTKLHFEDELKKPKSQSKLMFEVEKPVRKAGESITSTVHGKIHEVENDNSAVEGAHKTEIAAEGAVRHFSHTHSNNVNKPYERVSKLEHEAQIADDKLLFEKTVQSNPEMGKKSKNMNRHYQKQQIKKEYEAARRAGKQTAGKATASTARSFQEKASEKVEEFIAKHKKAFLWVGIGAAVIVFIAAGFSSCTAMFSSMGSSVVSTSYLSEDDAMLGAEAQYCQLEDELRDYLNTYEATHDYDEYHFDLDDIEHDPYVLVSALSALHGGEFTLAGAQGTIQMLFDKQYILTENVVHEVRYRTETRTGTTTSTDPETGETTTETYEYEVQVPYDYYICYVTLENFNLSHVPVYIMGEDELALYSAYMATLGNREDLFPGSGYVDKYINNPPSDYTVPAEYLNDEKFATLLTEAEKYLGYPYVWGGSNPSTSFDCSGFVSYVLTNSGLVNTGRLGAQGLCNVCTPVSRDNARPGDLVFFKGTYDTPGVSHVGIYVGNGVMLHCGDPIQYTSINTSYWQEHFYTFGRPAY